MSHPSPLPPTASAHYQVLRTVPSYDEAQRLVDRLSDAGFPVEHVRLVGTDLRLVEQVTGRMTYGKAALYGAASGAWLGLLIGLLLGLFTVVGWLSVILWAVLLGAVWGLIFGLLGHAATGGRRTSVASRAWRRPPTRFLWRPSTSRRPRPSSTPAVPRLDRQRPGPGPGAGPRPSKC